MDPSSHTELELFRDDLLRWGEENLRTFPWREPDATPFEILISEIFLKQTRSSTVARVLPEFLERYPDPESLRGADLQDLIEVIRPLGLYNTRARALKEIGDELQKSNIPESEEELKELPQVGRYVANATLCFGFKQPRPLVDSNVRRVYGRLFGADQQEPVEDDWLWTLAEAVLPEEQPVRFNSVLLDFGAEICTDSSPRCEECFASDYCDYYQKRGADRQ